MTPGPFLAKIVKAAALAAALIASAGAAYGQYVGGDLTLNLDDDGDVRVLAADVTAEGPIAELEAQFAQAIKSGDGAALKRFAGAAVEPQAVNIMTEANRRVREGLSPLLAVETGGVTVVFSAAPTQARFLYFTEYHRQADGQPAVRGVGAFDAYAQVR